MSKILDDRITPAYGTDRVSSDKSLEQIKAIIEALLFTAGEPVSINRLADTILADTAQIEDAALQLQLDYSGDVKEG